MWTVPLAPAAFELAIYVGTAFWYMSQHRGSGSGVFLIFLPIFWLLLVLRLWIPTRIALLIADARGITYLWGFLILATVPGLFTTWAIYKFVGFYPVNVVVAMGAHVYVSYEVFRRWRSNVDGVPQPEEAQSAG